MRTFGLASKIAVACGAAAGFLFSLGMPWYGAPPAPGQEIGRDAVVDPLTRVFDNLARWFGDPEGMTAYQAFGALDAVLGTVAVLAAIAAILCFVPTCEDVARIAIQWLAVVLLGTPGLCLVLRPGPNDLIEPRLGVFVALIAGAMLMLAVSQIAIAPSVRRRRQEKYRPITPPARWTEASEPPPMQF